MEIDTSANAVSMLIDMPSQSLELRLEQLAIRARATKEQTALMHQGMHLLLPKLLYRPTNGAADSRMKTQAARLIANLAYQPSNKSAIVEAGAIRALGHAVREAVPLATKPLLLEAAAALGNLASGADARRAMVGTDSEVVRLLTGLLSCPPSAADDADEHALIVAEAARALSNLSICSSTHAALQVSGAPERAGPLLEWYAPRVSAARTVLPPSGSCRRCAPPSARCDSDESEAHDGAHDDGAHDDASREAEGVEAAGHAARHDRHACGCRGGGATGSTSDPDDAIARPLLSRLLMMLCNLLRHRELAVQMLANQPRLVATLLAIALPSHAGVSRVRR